MTNRQNIKAMLSDYSPNGDKALIEFMNDKFNCPPIPWDDCSFFRNCGACWKHYLESKVEEQ